MTFIKKLNPEVYPYTVYKFFISLFLFHLTLNTNSQNIEQHFLHITTKDGLSHNRINYVFQDSRGFIWISTTDGLNRYDGKNISSYFNSDSFSICDNNTGQIVEDKNGNILVGTASGASKYNLNTNKFETVFYTKTGDLSKEAVLNILIDKKQRIWIATTSELYELDSSYKLIHSYSSQLYGDDLIFEISQDNAGNIWVNKSGKVNLVNPDNGFVINNLNNKDHLDILSYDHVGNITFDTTGNIWIVNNANELIKFNSKGYKLSQIALEKRVPFIDKFLITRDNKFWFINHYEGATLFNPINNTYTKYKHNESDLSSICENWINYINEDKQHNIWFATTNGLDILPYSSLKVELYNLLIKTKQGNEKGVQITAFEKHNNVFWISTWGHGLLKYEPKSNTSTFYTPYSSEIKNMIWVTKKIDDDLWFGNFYGLHGFNEKRHQFFEFENNPTYPKALDSIAVVDIYCDKHQNIWISLFGKNGIIKYNKEEKKFIRYSNQINDRFYFPFRHFNAVAEDKFGNMWFGYNRQIGLTLWNNDKQKFEIANHNGRPILNQQVNCLFIDENILWIGSNNGLYSLNLTNFSIKKYSRKDGIVNDNVHDIVKDDYNNLWIATDNGISVFNMLTKTFINYTKLDGLPAVELNQAVYSSTDQRVYFSSDFNFFSVSTQSDFNQKVELSPSITSFQIMNKVVPLNPDSLLKIKYKEKYFSFNFSAPFYPSASVVKYAYKMEGIDTDWIYIGNTQQISFTSLAYGHYSLQIKASVNGTDWYYLKKPVKIMVTAPFYLKTWFIVLFVLSSAVVFVLIIYSIYRAKLKRLNALQKMRNKIASDLHDDVGSALSSISFMAEVAKQQTTGADDWFNRIGENTRNIAENISDIVWSINPQNDSFENMLVRMRNFASEIFEAAHIEFLFEADENIETKKLDMEQRRHLYLIFKEIVNNASKHAAAKHVHIKFSAENSKIRMTIQDDGKGFDMHQSYTGNGLKNLEARAKLMNANLEIQSIAGQGSTFILII